jgi:imidazolonepropionase-like amidohydrolase
MATSILSLLAKVCWFAGLLVCWFAGSLLGNEPTSQQTNEPTSVGLGNGEEAAPRYVIRAGKILTVTQGVLNNGVVLVADGKIQAVGKDVEIPEGYQLIDALDKWLFPGFVDIHSHIGGVDLNDLNDMVLPLNPDLRTMDNVDLESKDLRDAVAGGVTTILYLPGSGTNHAGFGTLLKTAGDTLQERILRFPGAMKVTQAGNPERIAGDLGASRMGMTWMIRDLLREAKDYAAKLEAYQRGETKAPPAPRPDLDPLLPVIRKECPIFVHTYNARDVMATLRVLHDELGLWVICSHVAYGAFVIGDEAAKRGVPMNPGPEMQDYSLWRTDYWGPDDNRFRSSPVEFYSRGVRRLSLNTDTIGMWGLTQEELFYQGSMAVRYGLDEDVALRGITIEPARAIGIADRVGSIEVGKDADLVLKNGSPFDVRSFVEKVWINGKIVYDVEKEERRF